MGCFTMISGNDGIVGGSNSPYLDIPLRTYLNLSNKSRSFDAVKISMDILLDSLLAVL